MKKLSSIILALTVILFASCQEEESNPEIVSFSPVMGDYGDRVTIIGSNFDEFNTVLFGGVEANIVSVSPNQLVVTVPAGSKSGNITISEGDKRIESASGFTVTSGNWKKDRQGSLHRRRVVDGYFSPSDSLHTSQSDITRSLPILLSSGSTTRLLIPGLPSRL